MYTKDEIADKTKEIAARHGIAAVYLFGSYARGEATENSDVDLIVDLDGSDVRSLFDIGGLLNELEDVFGEDNVDIITEASINEIRERGRRPFFLKAIQEERVKIYGT
jgi:predicted nucleotidyltransferase